MKVKVQSWLFLFLLFACREEKQPDVQLTDLMREQLLNDVGVVQAEFRQKYQKEGFQLEHLRKLNDSKRVDSWKKKYLESRNRANLLQYTDSVIHNLAQLKIPNSNLKRLDWDNSLRVQPNIHQWTTAELLKSRDNYLASGNDSDEKELFLWTLKAEINYHYSNFYEARPLVSEYVTLSRTFTGYINTIINSREIKAGEPVYLIVTLSPEGEAKSFRKHFEIEPVTFWLRNLKTNKKIFLNPIRVKWSYILQTDPIREKGDYVIEGHVKIINTVHGPVNPPKGLNLNSIAVHEPFKVE